MFLAHREAFERDEDIQEVFISWLATLAGLQARHQGKQHY